MAGGVRYGEGLNLGEEGVGNKIGGRKRKADGVRRKRQGIMVWMRMGGGGGGGKSGYDGVITGNPRGGGIGRCKNVSLL